MAADYIQIIYKKQPEQIVLNTGYKRYRLKFMQISVLSLKYTQNCLFLLVMHQMFKSHTQ